MKRRLTSLTGMLIATLAAGAEIYVAPDGRDSNPGTKEKPFATVEAARDAERKINATMTEDIDYAALTATPTSRCRTSIRPAR